MGKLAAKLTSQFVVSLLVAALGLLVVAAAGVWGLSQTHGAADKLYTDQLRTVDETAFVGQELDDSYQTAQSVLLATTPLQRQRLMSNLFQDLVPSVEGSLNDLQQIHAGDPTNQVALVKQLEDGWSKFRSLWSASSLLAPIPDRSVVAAQLDAAFGPLEGVTDRLISIEQREANSDNERGGHAYNTSLLVIGIAVGIELLLGALLAWYLANRMLPRALAPEEAQAKFAEALLLASSEEEGRSLLRRYLERAIKGARVLILRRDDNTNTLRVVTPDSSWLSVVDNPDNPESVSCMAVNSARTYREEGDSAELLSCKACGDCPGLSICTPFTIGGEVVGSVLVNRKESFDADDERRIRDSILQATPVLANLYGLATAEAQAATDSLTGLPNKRSIGAMLNQMVAQAQRSSTPLAVLALDLDHFKVINDTYGHGIGDDVLAAVGSVLRSSLRSSDVAGRNGGEEFLVLLPTTDGDGALTVAENVRASIANIQLSNVERQISCSIGIAVFPQHSSDADGVMQNADRALYKAKAAGRNRVEMAVRVESELSALAIL